MLTAGNVQISGWVFIFRSLCLPVLLRADISLPRYLIQSFSRRAGVTNIYQSGDRETWRVQPSESSARWLRAEPTGRRPGPAGCLGAWSPRQGHRQSPLQLLRSPVARQELWGLPSSRPAAARAQLHKILGGGLLGPGLRPQSPTAGATAVTQEKLGDPRDHLPLP